MLVLILEQLSSSQPAVYEISPFKIEPPAQSQLFINGPLRLSSAFQLEQHVQFLGGCDYNPARFD